VSFVRTVRAVNARPSREAERVREEIERELGFGESSREAA